MFESFPFSGVLVSGGGFSGGENSISDWGSVLRQVLVDLSHSMLLNLKEEGARQCKETEGVKERKEENEADLFQIGFRFPEISPTLPRRSCVIFPLVISLLLYMD